MDFKKEIINLLKKEKIPIELLQAPPNPEMGDYALPCFPLAKQLKKSPVEIAKTLQPKFKAKFLEKVEANGPSLNFYINKEIYNKTIIESKTKKNKINKSIVIDFSSPNVMKPFGLAHLRSTMIGNSIHLLHKHLGYKVIRVNHLGDWGTQFGKMIYAYLEWGNPKDIEKEPIKNMLKLYVKYHKEAEKDSSLDDKARKIFADLESGNKKYRSLWKKFRDLSLKEYDKTYKRLNVSFDSFSGEAFYEPMLKDTISLLKKNKLLEESEGALIVNLDKYNLAPCLIQKSDGATIYATRDIAAAIYRKKEYNFHKNIYVTDNRQNLHFQQFFKVLELAKLSWAKDCIHIPFGIMKFNDGIMSTRKGKVIFLEEVLDKSVDKVKKIIKEKNPKLKNKDKIAEQIGIGAIIFWDLSHDRVKDIQFEWDLILDFSGETGPYIQYTYARASSILRKAKNKSKPSYEKLTNPKEAELIKLISDFESTIENAAQQYKPSVLAKYLLSIAQRFNEFYQSCPVLNEEDKSLAKARLNLISKTREILKEGLSLLAISTPEEM